MIFTVVWENAAEYALADIWNEASDRQDVADAADAIDKELRIDADQKGDVYGSLRLLAVPPLVVSFTVDPGDCMVRVLEVRRLPP